MPLISKAVFNHYFDYTYCSSIEQKTEIHEQSAIL